jgi:tRNA pseudouridine32 synthase/23S rRNA pseudouridine746 synthase
MSKPTERQEVHVPVESSQDNAVDLLHQATGLSKQRIKSAMTRGAVWLTRGKKTQRLRRAKRTLAEDDEVHLYYDEKILAEAPTEPTLLADIGGYSVWRKQQHLQPERPAFTVHRLDRAASGLLLVAHSKSMAAELSRLFGEREIEKRYRAVVVGDLSQGPAFIQVEEPIDEKEAISEVSFRQLSADGERSLVDIRIETGRKHQIRRHLAALGHPVCGDRLYGEAAEGSMDLQLTAYLLAFHCPVNDERVEYRLPAEWIPEFS